VNGARGRLVRHVDIELRPDGRRVVAKTFLPGQEILTPGISRATGVLGRIARMSDAEAEAILEVTLNGFTSHHPDLRAMLDSRFELVAHRLENPEAMSPARRMLIGAYFTQEYAVESAALFNPSMVIHPDQTGLAEGSLRFVMSVRGVGEGHISCIEFRVGTIDVDDNLLLVEPSGMAVLPVPVDTVYSKQVMAQQLAEMGDDVSSSDYVLMALPPYFSHCDLEAAVTRLDDQGLTRGFGAEARAAIRWIAACNYAIEFPIDSTFDERVIIPTAPSESRGLEDVRLVRFTDAEGNVDYRGTYTAFDGSRIVPQLLRTDDFRTFRMSQLGGQAAKDKGMALFPRPVHGQYLALSRSDRENILLAESDDLRVWHESALLHTPQEPWETIQIGNCGSPIETERGWIVLTHGVGPMREYSIGALLLDLDDPRVVLGRLAAPLLSPRSDDRSGYVPNVVYSCGGLLHGDTLVLPYGCNDVTVRVALVHVPDLLDSLVL
jgi:predicted GH43/DUF377 family glycosyl hydrolase